MGIVGQGGETSIWDALGVPKGASDHEIVAAWESVRKQRVAEVMSGDADHEVEPGEKAGGVKPGRSNRDREGVVDGGTVGGPDSRTTRNYRRVTNSYINLHCVVNSL